MPKLKSTIEAHTSFVFGVDITPNGKLLASAGWDGLVRVIDLASEQELWSWTRKP